MDKIKISTSERVLITGATGSGKTVLAKKFLAPMDRVMVIDPKHTFSLPEYKPGFSLPRFGHSFRVVVRPSRKDDSKMVDLLEKAYRQGNVTIYVDEMTTVSESFKETTDFLAEIARTGRERKIALWSAMQRPRWSPKIFITESEVFFVFSLRAEEDRKYIAGFAGSQIETRIPKYQFWYQRTDADSDPALLTLDLEKNKILPVGKESL